MPNGKTHKRAANVTLTLGALPAVVVALLLPAAGAGALGGLWYGKKAPPDLDHHAVTEDEKSFYRVHPALGRWWVNLWKPYDLANPHRGRSHKWPFGTWDRFWYLLKKPVWISGAVALVAGFMLPHELGLPYALLSWAAFWVSWFAGQSTQDLVHIWLDVIVSFWRRLLKIPIIRALRWLCRLLFVAPPRRRQRRAPAKTKLKTR